MLYFQSCIVPTFFILLLFFLRCKAKGVRGTEERSGAGEAKGLWPEREEPVQRHTAGNSFFFVLLCFFSCYSSFSGYFMLFHVVFLFRISGARLLFLGVQLSAATKSIKQLRQNGTIQINQSVGHLKGSIYQSIKWINLSVNQHNFFCCFDFWFVCKNRVFFDRKASKSTRFSLQRVTLLSERCPGQYGNILLWGHDRIVSE